MNGKDESRARLLEVLRPGMTVRTILRHCSSSGMTRWISALVLENGEAREITCDVANVLGWRLSRRRDGVEVGGAGMDMGFHLVYTLSYALFGSGWDCVGERCPAASHVNDRNAPRGAGVVHKDGYALSHRWL